MVSPPQHDWNLVELRSRREDAEWLRGLTPQERFVLYEDLLNLVSAHGQIAGDQEQVDRWCFAEKAAIRRRMIDAYKNLDKLHSERATANNVS